MNDLLIELVRTTVTAIILAAVPVIMGILVQYLRKINLQLTEAQTKQISSQVQNILLEAEEWANARLKSSIPVTPAQKMDRAVAAIQVKLPHLDDHEAEKLVRQELPKVGLGSTPAA